MAITESLPARPPERSRTKWPVAWPALVPACLLTLGYAPLLVLQARALWDRPHLQAFPVAVVAGLVLAGMASRRLGRLEPGSRPRSLAAVGIGGALLVLAAVSAWPWLGALAALVTVLAGVYGLGGGRLLRAVLPAWGFVALAILPPNSADLRLITRLQTLVTACASPVLDAMGVIHLTEGNVIRIVGRRLMVEKACSGVSSLFAVFGVTLFFVLWSRRKPAGAAVLVLAAFFWVVLGNIARVVIVVLSEARWGVRLESGWRHEALGLVIFAAVLGLIVSTDDLWRFVSALTTIRLYPTLVWDGLDQAPAPPAVVELPPVTVLPEVGRTCLGSWPIGAGFGLLGLVQVAWLWPLLADAVSADPVVVALQTLKEGDLPDRAGPYLRQGFVTEDRGRESAFGEFSREWRYRSDRASAIVSVDYPFRGWHELTQCYQGTGWALRERVVRPGDGTGAFVEAEFDRPPDRHEALMFGLDDMRGGSLEPRPSRNLFEYLGNRFDILRSSGRQLVERVGSRYRSMPPGYQVQLLIETDERLSPARRAEARAFFDQVRQDVRRRVAPGTGREAKGGRRERGEP